MVTEINVFQGVMREEVTDYKGAQGNFGVIEILSILIVVITQLYTFVKTQNYTSNKGRFYSM